MSEKPYLIVETCFFLSQQTTLLFFSPFFCPFSGIKESSPARETFPSPEGRLGHGTDLGHLANKEMIPQYMEKSTVKKCKE